MKTIYISSRDRECVNKVLRNMQFDVSSFEEVVGAMPTCISSLITKHKEFKGSVKEALLSHPKHERKLLLAYIYLLGLSNTAVTARSASRKNS